MSAKTSLARQLELLKLPQTSAHKEKHGSVSFLYDFFEAKTIDSDTHFSVALNGLDNLILLDPYIETYKNTIFHESSKQFDRGVKSNEVNEKINQVLEEFLFRVVSKYFQLSDTHKALEWLIYRYKVNEYNPDALIGSVLPYHETRLFVRLLQTCSVVKNPQNNRWYWLKSIQENGVPLSKSFLLDHCVSNLEFIRFITDSVFKSMQIDPENTLFPSFLVSFLMNILERSTTEQIVTQIVSIISKALRMKNHQLYISSYLILTQLCSLTQLENGIVEKLLKSFWRNVHPETIEVALISFSIVLSTQKFLTLPLEIIDENIIKNLKKYSQFYNFESLIECLILTMIKSVSLEFTDEEIFQTYKQHCKTLFENSNCICEDLIKSIISSINDIEDISDNRQDFIFSLIKLIEQSYPTWFDNAISSLKSVKNVPAFLNSVRYSFVDNVQVPLFVGLNHSNKKIRRESMFHFAKNFEKFLQNTNQSDLAYLKSVIESNLIQDLKTANPDVLLQIFSIKQLIFNLLSAKDFEKIASHIIGFCEEVEIANSSDDNNLDEVNKWRKLKCLLLEVYCSQSIVTYVGDVQDQSIFFNNLLSFSLLDCHLFNYLFPTDLNQFEFAETILNSKLSQSNSLLKSITSSTKTIVKKIKKALPEDQDALILEFSKTILTCIVEYFIEYFDSDLFSSNSEKVLKILSCSKNSFRMRRFSLLYLFVLSNVYLSESNSKLNTTLIAKSILDITVVLISNFSLNSKSEVKILKGIDYEKLDIWGCLLNQPSFFNDTSISIFPIGYIVYNLIKHLNISLLLNERNSLLGTFFQVSSPTSNFLSKLYHLLIYYSTVEDNKFLSKRIYKLFRDLLAFLVRKVVDEQNVKDCFKFFIPFITDCSNSYLQSNTLGLLNGLMNLEPLSSSIVTSLESNANYLIAFIIALSSDNINCRRLALKNLKSIQKRIKNTDVEEFLIKILECNELYVGDSNCICLKLNQLQDSNQFEILNTIFETLVKLLYSTSGSYEITLPQKHSVLKLLRSSSISVKADLFEFYRSKFITGQSRKLSVEEEQELSFLLDFYRFDQDCLFGSSDSCFTNFYISLIESMKDTLSDTLSLTVIEMLSNQAFQKIYSANQEDVVRLICTILRVQLDLSENSSSTNSSLVLINSIRNQLSLIEMNSVLVVRILKELLPIELIYDTYAYTRKSAPNEKKIRLNDTSRSLIGNKWKLLRIFLGLFQNNSILHNESLVKVLFEYLKLTFMDVDDNSNEYTRQTLLTVIMACMSSYLEGKNIENNMEMDVDGDASSQANTEYFNSFDVDIIVDCMRESRLKQTQKIALHLINSIAPYFQRQIIEYLVTIFTFIGTSLIQCDDFATLDILLETLDSIIPVILKHDKSVNQKVLQSKGAEIPGPDSDLKQYIISVFVKSFGDIPSYRRLELFHRLIELLGQEEFLPVVAVRLFEQACYLKNKTEKQVWLDFVLNLFSTFNMPQQLTSTCILLILFEAKFFDSQLKKKALQQDLIETKTMDVDNGGQPDDSIISLDYLKTTSKSITKKFKTSLMYDSDKFACGVEILKFVVTFISNPEFVQSLESAENNQISSTLIYFLNVLLRLIVSLNPNASSISTSLNIYRKKIKYSLDEILLAYNNLMPNENLIDIVIDDLLNNSIQMEPFISALVKRKALELLNAKLVKLSSKDLPNHIPKKIIKTMGKHLAQEKTDSNTFDETQIHNIQLIFLSLKLSAKFLETNDSKSVTISRKTINILDRILLYIIKMTKSIKTESMEQTPRVKLLNNLKGSSILCITQIMCTMSLEGIQQLSDVLKIILNNFNINDDIIIISNVSALAKIIFKFSQFLSPFLKDIILKLLYAFTLCDRISNLRSKLQFIWNELSKSVPKRVMFQAINASYEDAVLISNESIVMLMNLFKLTCSEIEKSDVEIIVKCFKDFMIKALSYRSLHFNQVDLHLIERIETSFGEAFSSFIPKLTETSFRPIFYHLLEWAILVEDKKILNEDNSYSLSDECYYKMIAFYRFCSFLADRLKSLFCVFVAPSIIKNCSEMLMAYHSKNFQTENETATNEVEDQHQTSLLKLKESKIGEPLISAILATLSKCFLYDLNGNFVNKDCSILIIKPIVNQVFNWKFLKMFLKFISQISNLFGSSTDFQNRLESILQCTQYLIQNNKDETLIKDYNYQILLKTRDSNEKVGLLLFCIDLGYLNNLNLIF